MNRAQVNNVNASQSNWIETIAKPSLNCQFEAESIESKNPFNHESLGSFDQIKTETAFLPLFQQAQKGFTLNSAFSPHRRAQLLNAFADCLTSKQQDFVWLLSREIGKPLQQCQYEIDKAIDVFRLSAEEALRIDGLQLPLNRSESGCQRFAYLRYLPLGVVLAITPYNYPILTVAHKIAPALAAGNSVIFKPSPHAALVAYNFWRLFEEAGFPSEIVSLFYCEDQITQRLVEQAELSFINFTGSSKVGWNLRSRAHPGSKLILELGGNAPVIVHEDADLTLAVQNCLRGAYAFSGQSCISTQRIFVHQRLFTKFTELFCHGAKPLRAGDPLDESTDLGPLINAAACRKVREMVLDAQRYGGELLCGGEYNKKNNCFEATIVQNCPDEALIMKEEIFGPLAVINPYCDIEKVLVQANNTSYGLSAGFFSQNLKLCHWVAEKLNFGTVMINDSSAYRPNEMPVGAVNQSGCGLEGPRFAIREMSQTRVICINLA